MFIFDAKKNYLQCKAREILTSGAQNVFQCQFRFDATWDGLDKTAVFRSNDGDYSVLLDGTDQCTIPWEALQHPGHLSVGVYGTKGGELVLPTVWATAGKVLQGAHPGEEAKDPTPGVYEQILSTAKRAEEVAAKVAEDADNGAFTGPVGPTGAAGVTPHIGGNGNWYIGDTDTGIPASGGTGLPSDRILPTVTAADAGKFLRVSADGIWVAYALPNAEEASF